MTNRDDSLYNELISRLYDANLVDFVFLKDYEKITNIEISDDDARKEVKDKYVSLYKREVKIENMRQYLRQNIIEYKALNEWDLFVELKNGDRFIYDSFANAPIFDLYETEDLTEEQEIREFSKNLRKIIRRKFITQEELADRMGVTRVSINRYITGKLIPDGITLRKMAKALGCSIEDFFYRKY